MHQVVSVCSLNKKKGIVLSRIMPRNLFLPFSLEGSFNSNQQHFISVNFN